MYSIIFMALCDLHLGLSGFSFDVTHTHTHTLLNAVSFSMALGVIVSEQGEVHKRHSPEVTFPTIHLGLLNHYLTCQQQGGRMDF